MKVLVIAPCLFAILIGVSLAAENRFIDDYWQHSVALGAFENGWEIGKCLRDGKPRVILNGHSSSTDVVLYRTINDDEDHFELQLDKNAVSNWCSDKRVKRNAINKEGVYYLMLGTSHDPYDCVSINVTATFPNIAMHYEVTKYNASIPFTYKYNGTALVHKDVRDVESTIEWIKNDTGHIRKSQVLYTEKENRCFVLFYPDTSDYELWVNTNETNFIPRCCEFAFIFVTYELPTYINFNHTICKHVLEETGD